MEISTFANDQSNRIQRTLEVLAFKRLQYTREIEKIDERIKELSGADEANTLIRKELETNAVVEAAQVQAAAGKKIGEK